MLNSNSTIKTEKLRKIAYIGININKDGLEDKILKDGKHASKTSLLFSIQFYIHKLHSKERTTMMMILIMKDSITIEVGERMKKIN